MDEKIRAAELLVRGGFGTSVLMTDSGSVNITIEPGWDHPQRRKPEEKMEEKPAAEDPLRVEAVDLLRDAMGVLGRRGASHGALAENFGAIARISTAMGIALTPQQVALVHVATKLGRASAGDAGHKDHYLDAINYIAIAWVLRSRGP